MTLQPIDVVPFANPAVGTEFSLTVPPGEWWKLISGHLTFASSAQVANRNLTCNANVAGVEYWVDAVPLDVPASRAIEISLNPVRAPGGAQVPFSSGIIGNLLLMGLPNFWLPPGWIFKTATIGLQTNDQYSLCEFVIEKARAAGDATKPDYGDL